ncbi:MAG: ATP synthase F1 subunit gamma [Bacilli bacterium]|nr:ATP synthase F1 subunit gamma [Bacilli bacterium]
MAGETKFIKGKIQATKKTAQITKAMNMVSASKLKQAQLAITNYISFIDKIEEIIANLVSSGDVKHPLLEERSGDKTCYIIITSERGLAGPFNSNIYKMLSGIIKDGDSVLPYGGRGYNYCKNKYSMLIDKPVILRDDVRFDDIISSLVLVVTKYLQHDFDKVKVIYNHFVNTLNQTQEIRQILPVETKKLDYVSNYNKIYDFEGGVEGLLDKVLPIYIENIVYGIILDSKASEHASRMTAMKNATDNAEEIISSLELMYNRARQSAITLELTDIIGGANATN